MTSHLSYVFSIVDKGMYIALGNHQHENFNQPYLKKVIFLVLCGISKVVNNGKRDNNMPFLTFLALVIIYIF